MRMSGEITTVGNGRSYLTQDQLQPLTSLFAETPMPGVSTKYRQVKTMDVLNIFTSQGWFPVKAQQQMVRLEDKRGFQKHMIRMRQQLPAQKGDLFPEVVLTNSHDRSSAYQLMAGIFRLICMNGAVVSEAEFGTIRIKHMGFEPKEIVEASKQFGDGLPRIMGKVEEYQKIDLTDKERGVFAESALLMKYAPGEDMDEKMINVNRSEDGNLFQIDKRQFDVKKLLTPVRNVDTKPTLWNTFNVIQEKMTKGNRFEIDTRPYHGGMKKVREIKGINESVRVNRGLWHLQSEFAKMKGAN